MNFEAFVLAVSLIFLIFSLYKELFHPAATFLIVISILVFLEVLTPEEALQGFSNPQVAVIVLLIIVTSILRKFKVTALLFKKVASEKLSYKAFLLRLMTLTSFLSSFLNNTPVVATLIPYVYDWSRKRGLSPSKLLIPLSYAAILGGTVTLIGTSTNLVVNALYVGAGYPSLKMSDFMLVGLPATALGIAYMYFIGNKLLPDRKDLLEDFYEKKRRYLVETIVPPGSPVIGKSVQEANLRGLKGLFLAEIVRGRERIFPVSPDDEIKEKDILIFVGETDKIVDIVKGGWGLELPSTCHITSKKDKAAVEVVEAVVPYNSSLIGKKVRDTDFRAKYDAVILAVHRNGEKLSGKVGEIVLKPGDLLLILTGKDFWKRISDSDDIYVMTKVTQIDNINERYGIASLFLFLFVLLLSSIGIFPLFSGLLLLLSLFVILNIATYGEIKRSLDFNLIIIAALSISLGYAMVKTGLANSIANTVISFVKPLGITVALISIYLITNFLTEFVTNIAAASISFPIALSMASQLGANPKAFILAVAFSASASFLTPIGYQTNLMVYSTGNYKFSDFVKVGLPLAILYMFTTTSLLKIYFL